MKAAIVDNAGKLLYFGNTKNPKFEGFLPGNTIVNVPPRNEDTWNGISWSTSYPALKAAPDALKDTSETVD